MNLDALDSFEAEIAKTYPWLVGKEEADRESPAVSVWAGDTMSMDGDDRCDWDVDSPTRSPFKLDAITCKYQQLCQSSDMTCLARKEATSWTRRKNYFCMGESSSEQSQIMHSQFYKSTQNRSKTYCSPPWDTVYDYESCQKMLHRQLAETVFHRSKNQNPGPCWYNSYWICVPSNANHTLKSENPEGHRFRTCKVTPTQQTLQIPAAALWSTSTVNNPRIPLPHTLCHS